MSGAQNLAKRMLASIFVLAGGVVMAGWIWPDGAVNTFGEAFEAAVAIFGLGTSLIVVWSLWSNES